MEGYVAFLPVAFVFLLLILSVGRGHIFPWTHEAYPNPEKATYFNPAFLTIRDIGIFAAFVALGIYYIYTSLRLDVGRVPEWGAKLGGEHSRRHAQRLRRRASRDSFDAFSPGQARRVPRGAVRARVLCAVVGPVDGAVAPFPEHALQLVVLHGRLAVRAHAVLDPRSRVEYASRTAPAG